MKKHKRKIQTGIVIGIFSVIIIACLISIFSRMYTENKEKEAFRQLAEIVTEDTTDATIEETIKKPNILKVSDFDNEVQAEQTVYCTTYYEPHSISELISMNSECFGWISISGTNINYPVMHTPSNPLTDTIRMTAYLCWQSKIKRRLMIWDYSKENQRCSHPNRQKKSTQRISLI